MSRFLGEKRWFVMMEHKLVLALNQELCMMEISNSKIKITFLHMYLKDYLTFMNVWIRYKWRDTLSRRDTVKQEPFVEPFVDQSEKYFQNVLFPRRVRREAAWATCVTRTRWRSLSASAWPQRCVARYNECKSWHMGDTVTLHKWGPRSPSLAPA